MRAFCVQGLSAAASWLPLVSRPERRVAERELPESYDSAPLTERRLAGVWASRTRLLGAYAFAAGVLGRLGAPPPWIALFATTPSTVTSSVVSACHRSETARCVAPVVLCGAVAGAYARS